MSADHPTAWWRLEEGPGALVLADQLGVRPATLNTSTDLTYRVPGVAGTGLAWGVGLHLDQYATVSPILPLTSGAWSIEFWIRPQISTGSYGNVVGETGTPGAPGFFTQDTGGGKVQIAYVPTDGGGGLTTTELTLGVLYQIGLASDGAGNSLFYVNGVVDSAPIVTGLGFTVMALFGGIDGAGPTNYPLACDLIDELVVYPTALSAGRWAAHYAAGLASL